MKYIAYYRVSTAGQGKSGLGLEAQRHSVVGFANGSPIIAEFIEVESGKRDDRPQLAAALAMAKARDATLLIAKLDRLNRDVHFISRLLKQSVPIKACDIPNADNLHLHIMAAVAEKEREMIRERTKAAIAAKRARGEAWGTNMAKILHANKEAKRLAITVNRIRASGDLSLREIADALNAKGVQAPRGGQWHAMSISRLLSRIDGTKL